MRRLFPVLIILLLTTLLAKADVKAAPRQAAPRSAAEIIALINEYRIENGLPAYVQNSILMGTAQDQSNYQAAIGSVTHEGPGGSRPRDRAYAAGYGDGKIIWISEIIYGYTSAGPDAAVNWWKTSEIHNYTMLAPQYVHIGAGVAVADGRYYYTAVVGWITIYDNPDATPTAGPSPTPSYTPSKTPSKTPIPSSTSIPASPSASWTSGPSPTASNTPTPLPEGTIIHIVKIGDTLSSIAALYGVPLEQILALNNLTLTSLIFPGNQIIIQVAPTATATPTASATDSSTTTSTASPTASPTDTPSATASATATSSPTSTPESEILALAAASEGGNASIAQDRGAAPNTAVRTLIAVALAAVAIVPVAILVNVFRAPRG